MTDGQPQFPVHRIVIALESICDHVKALEIATEMAARIKAELHGIFMEDVNLLSAAHLPFVHQVNLHSAAAHSFEPTDIEAEFRALATRARTCLQGLANRAGVPWSFEIHRGDRSSLVSATRRTDLLVVETATRPFARYMKLPTDWSEVSLRSERACLLLSASASRQRGILVVHDGTDAGERAMAAGLALDGAGGALAIVAPTAVPENADAQRRLHVAGIEADLHRIERLNSTELMRVMTRANCDLAILPASLAIEYRSALQELLAAPPCAVLLVR
jgi:hypothetical protein